MDQNNGPNQYLIGVDTSWTSNFNPGISSDSNMIFVESTTATKSGANARSKK